RVTAAQRLRIAIGVQHHDVPVAQIITVVAFVGRTGLGAPIREITGRGAIAIFVVRQGGFGAVLELTPCLVIAVSKLIRAPLLISQIPAAKTVPGICAISLAVACALARCWQAAMSPAPT